MTYGIIVGGILSALPGGSNCPETITLIATGAVGGAIIGAMVQDYGVMETIRIGIIVGFTAAVVVRAIFPRFDVEDAITQNKLYCYGLGGTTWQMVHSIAENMIKLVRAELDLIKSQVDQVSRRKEAAK